ncbi:MAG: aldo/keto reductase [Acidimicrobiia bacterium]
MKKRKVGSLDVSVVGLGGNQFGRKVDREMTSRIIDAALECGVTFLDTADRYGYGRQPFSGQARSEEFIGAALRGRREEVILATKFGNPMGDNPQDRGGSRRYVKVACERSLKRLQTDYIDLYQIHSPDPDTPVEETLEALTDLVTEGKVREIGCSDYSVAQLQEAVGAAERGGLRCYVSIQEEYSLLERSAAEKLLPFCEGTRIAFLPYFPLAGGLLTGKYRRNREIPQDARLAEFPPNRPHLGLSTENLDQIERLSTFAEDRGHSLLELAFAWLLAHPPVASVFAGATRPDQVEANARAARWELTAQELKDIANLTR